MTESTTKAAAGGLTDDSEVQKRQELFAAEIAPLLRQVHAICLKSGIAMAAGFALGDDGEGRMPCVAVKSLPEGFELPVNLQLAFMLLEDPRKMLAELGSLVEESGQVGSRMVRPGVSRLLH